MKCFECNIQKYTNKSKIDINVELDLYNAIKIRFLFGYFYLFILMPISVRED